MKHWMIKHTPFSSHGMGNTPPGGPGKDLNVDAQAPAHFVRDDTTDRNMGSNSLLHDHH